MTMTAAPVLLTFSLACLLQNLMVVLAADTYQVPCKAGEVRLVNGYNEREGSVEFCFDGAWSTVCGKNWDLRAAQTVCEQLRFPRHEAIAFQDSHYGEGVKSSHFIKFRCESAEDSLLNCKHKTYKSYDHEQCGAQTAGIKCSSMPPTYTSCEDVLLANPQGIPGHYDLLVNRSYKTVHCSFDWDIPCGSGLWFPVALVNMSKNPQSCPGGYELLQDSGVTGCVIPNASAPGCISAKFVTKGFKYTKVCGRAIGYQYATPDAFGYEISSTEDSIDSAYVDGVSITRSYPRQHVWTYTSSFWEASECPCQPNFNAQPAPSYVGNDYYCESGNPSSDIAYELFTGDVLWDGLQCGLQIDCCQAPNMPWFVRSFNTPSNDYIEVRLCQDQDIINERVMLTLLELYIQ